MYKSLSINNIDALVFDFDGVLTDNKVTISQGGEESVTCSRADGLAFDVLRKLEKSVYILSTEKNPVVEIRAKKLNVPVIQGVSDKVLAIKEVVREGGYNLKNILYVGNDLNDYLVMKICGYTACPSDSHPKIKKISRHILTTKGGNGVVREVLEKVFNLDFIDILYSSKEVSK
jgi:3-deoxy-D-manno-octulosonate 8-phosphate phosphatase (KDO 8-P phosphatase)